MARKCELWLFLVILAVSAAHGQVEQGWDVTTDRTLVYTLRVDMAHDGTQFTEQDERTLTVHIHDGQVELVRHSLFEGATEEFGPYLFTPDGKMMRMLPTDAPPPMEAELLLHVFAKPPSDPGVLAWDVTDPLEEELAQEQDKISLQQRTYYTFLGQDWLGGDTVKHYTVMSYLRLIDNAGLATLIGPKGRRPPEIQQIVDELGKENLFLFGTVSWNVEQRATVAYEATYVPVPHSGGSVGTIATSPWRQHLITPPRR